MIFVYTHSDNKYWAWNKMEYNALLEVKVTFKWKIIIKS